ncbi:hypothetical protein EDC96DRAFT_511036 [Choanephora cucurbitarum]|nr:hypothetical protein EDC96DRAFT_533240 [Choanephora cucurbitarum]KAI8364539.1 hypothetical protein EDC96DRAFT_511036 [Choanephora cucurbitarum]
MTSLPNELLQNIIQLTEQPYLSPWLFVCKYTFQLVRHYAYKKVIFPDKGIDAQTILSFCEIYGYSIETIKLPRQHYFPDTIYHRILQLCPQLDYLQSNIYPNQLKSCLPHMHRQSTCFMATDIPHDMLFIQESLGEEENEMLQGYDMAMFHSDHQTITYFACCPSFFVFPNELRPEKNPALTQISHYFHHPGALSNAILPTFGPDLLSLTLNPYDVLTSSVARLIVTKCPRLRYLVVPSVKAEGLWMLLRWCHTLCAIVVGHDGSFISFDDDDEEDEEDEESNEQVEYMLRSTNERNRQVTQNRLDRPSRRELNEAENERAVETVRFHKRVWCVHHHVHEEDNLKRVSWHIGIIPKI